MPQPAPHSHPWWVRTFHTHAQPLAHVRCSPVCCGPRAVHHNPQCVHLVAGRACPLTPTPAAPATPSIPSLYVWFSPIPPTRKVIRSSSLPHSAQHDAPRSHRGPWGGSVCGHARNPSHVPHPLSASTRRGHSACFHVLTVANSAAGTLGYGRGFERAISRPPGTRPGEGLRAVRWSCL